MAKWGKGEMVLRSIKDSGLETGRSMVVICQYVLYTRLVAISEDRGGDVAYKKVESVTEPLASP